MLNLAILGCGQIGSRHLQSLALMDERAHIYLVDPSHDALETACSRFHQVLDPAHRENYKIIQCQSVPELPGLLDFVIIASGSRNRAVLCRELMQQSEVPFVILEKFLFQQEVDYTDIAELFAARKVRAWCNQWVSSLYAFRRIASWIGAEPLEMRVDGAGWGLCCNTVHFLEYFDFLTGRGKLKVGNVELAPGFITSKREGYQELVGRIEITSENNSRLILDCQAGEPTNAIDLSIFLNKRQVRIKFALDRLECDFQEEARRWTETFFIPMQSHLTHFFVQQCMIEGSCSLPDLERASLQHLLVLPVFLEHFQKCGIAAGDLCPIT